MGDRLGGKRCPRLAPTLSPNSNGAGTPPQHSPSGGVFLWAPGSPPQSPKAHVHALFSCEPLHRRTLFLFLRFELLEECSEMQGDGGRQGVILVFEALPNC